MFDDGNITSIGSSRVLQERAKRDGIDDVLAKLQLVNLLELELRNDYAAGEVLESKKKSIFRRYMYPIFAALGLTTAGGIAGYKYLAPETAVQPIESREVLPVPQSDESKKKEIEGLIVKFGTSKDDVRQSVIRSLINSGKPAIDFLIKDLRDFYGAKRILATEALGEMAAHEDEVVKALIEALDGKIYKMDGKGYGHTKSDEAAAAAIALGKIKDSRAIEPLIKALIRVRHWGGPGLSGPPGGNIERDSTVRETAKKALTDIGQTAVPQLIEVMKETGISIDKVEDMRVGASAVLGEIGDKRAIPVLTEALKDTSESVRKAAKEAIEKIEKAQKKGAAIQPLQNPAGETSAATPTAPQAETQKSINTLLKELEDKSWDIRYRAATDLGKTKNKIAIQPLIEAVQDESNHVREAAMEGLVKMGQPAVMPIIEAMKERGLRFYADILIKIGQPSVQPLIAELKGNGSRIFKAYCAYALGKIGDKQAVQPLLEALKNVSSEIRADAASALGEIGDKQAVQHLFEALKDGSRDVRKYAAIALSKLGHREVAQQLIEALKDKDWHVRESAADTLNQIGWAPQTEKEKITFWIAYNEMSKLVKLGKPAIPSLIEVLRDDHYYVRKSAAETLDALRWVPQTEEEKAYYLVAKKDWTAVAKIGQPAIPSLVNALKDNEYDIYWNAGKVLDQIGWKPQAEEENIYYLIAKDDRSALVRIGKPAVLAVERLLWRDFGNRYGHDQYNNIRRAAVEVLGEIGESQSIEPIKHRLYDSDWSVRAAAVEALDKLKWKPQTEQEKAVYLIAKKDWDALVKMGEPAVPRLLFEMLNDLHYNNETRGALIRIGEKAVLPLVKKLVYKREDLRINVVKALGEMGYTAKDALPKLRELAERDTFMSVRIAAKEAIEKIEKAQKKGAAIQPQPKIGSATSPSAAEEKMIEGIRRKDQAPKGEINPATPTAPQAETQKEIGLIQGLIEQLKSSDDVTRETAVRALVNNHGKAAVPYIGKILNDPAFGKMELRLIWALGDIGSGESVPILMTNYRYSLFGRDDYRPRFAFEAVRRIGKNGVPYLMKYLKEKDPEMKSDAVLVLGHIGRDAKDSVGLLKELVKDDKYGYSFRADDFHLKIQAIRALLAIGDEAVLALNELSSILPKGNQISDDVESAIWKIQKSTIGKDRNNQVTPQEIKRIVSDLDYYRRDVSSLDALIRIGEPAVPYLMEVLKNRDESNWERRAAAADALGKIGGEKAFQALMEMVNSGVGGYNNDIIDNQVIRALGVLGDKRAVSRLLARLQAPYGFRQEYRVAAAASALGDIGDKSAAMPLLGYIDFYMCGSAVSQALIKIGNTEVATPLIEMLKSANPPLSAISVLGGLKDPRAFDIITKYLKHKENKFREEAINALTLLGDKRAVGLLIETLKTDKDKSYNVQRAAIKALAEIGDKEVVIPIFIEELKKDGHLVNEAIYALGKIGDERAIPALIDVINKKPRPFSPHYGAFGEIIRIEKAQKIKKLISDLMGKRFESSDEIAKMGELAVPYLIEIVNDKNEDWSVLVAAADILGKIGGEKVFKYFLKAQKTFNRFSRDNSGASRLAIGVLGDIGDERAIQDLIERLEAPEDMNEIKRWAVENALVKIGGKIGIEKIIDALIKEMERLEKSNNVNARESVALALGNLGNAKALPVLRKARNSKDKYVRQAAEQAIEKIEKAQSEKAKTKPVEKESSRSGAMEGRDLVREVNDATFERLWSGEAITVGDQAADARINGAAMSVLATLGVFALPKPEDIDIHAIAARIKSLDVEVFMPRSQFPKETLRIFKDGLGRIFGDKLRVYDDLADLAAMIKDPQKTVVMTVDLSSEKVIAARNSFNNLKNARFMNFENTNIEELIDQGVHENYIMDVLSKLLVARAITKEEASDTSSSYYRMMAHLLSNHLPKEEIDAYIRQIANDDMDPFIKMLNLIKQILRAMPIERYRTEQMKSAVQVLWAA
ncbi:MAG: HEAT repeat domain-containing protein [Candidatus Omnitrophota bacterium]